MTSIHTQQWYSFLEDKGDELPLDEAMFLIAKEEDPTVDIAILRQRMDNITDKLYLPSRQNPFDCIARINIHLFQKHQFTGDVSDYYHPHNSQLHQVLNQRKGLPILLSAIYMEIARRVNFKINGIGFPGHFIIQPAENNEPPFFIDPFRQGKILCPEDLQQMLRQVSQEGPSLKEATQAINNRQIVLRMSGNLFYAYQKRQHPTGMLRNIDRMLVLNHNAYNLHRIRSQILTRLCRYQDAAQALEEYLEKCPVNSDIEECIQELSLLKGIG